MDEATIRPDAPTDAPPPGPAQDPSTPSEQRTPVGANGSADPVREAVLEALHNVLDPELGINIVDLGLVYEVDIAGETVHITYTLTTMGCPDRAAHRGRDPPVPRRASTGVDEVDAEMVLRPPWTPEMMSEEAKAALGFF